jgi:predicted Zn-dependent protease
MPEPSTDDRRRHARELYEKGELDRALPLLLSLRSEQPDDATIAALAAWTHDSLGLEAEAVAHYRAAAAGDLPEADRRAVMLGFASTLRVLGRDEEAGQVFAAAVEQFPDFPALRVFQAMHFYDLGQGTEALAQVIRVLVASCDERSIRRYRRALSAYADDLDRSWLDHTHN